MPICCRKRPRGFAERIRNAAKRVNVVDPVTAKSFIESSNPIILDVRDSSDPLGSIQGAIGIPLSDLFFAADENYVLAEDVTIRGVVVVAKGTSFAHDVLKGSKDKPILVTCGLGGQALIAAEVLIDYGFTNVKALRGGNANWANSGEPVYECHN